MSTDQELTLEIMSGPLDGAVIALDGDTEWSRAGEGPLAFPWDEELGAPQARFTQEGDGWWLEGLDAPHGTYRINREERVGANVKLQRGDLLKAHNTWLLVRSI
jgi:hypothetical protein